MHHQYHAPACVSGFVHSGFCVPSRISLPDLLQLLARQRKLPRVAGQVQRLHGLLFGSISARSR